MTIFAKLSSEAGKKIAKYTAEFKPLSLLNRYMRERYNFRVGLEENGVAKWNCRKWERSSSEEEITILPVRCPLFRQGLGGDFET